MELQIAPLQVSCSIQRILAITKTIHRRQHVWLWFHRLSCRPCSSSFSRSTSFACLALLALSSGSTCLACCAWLSRLADAFRSRCTLQSKWFRFAVTSVAQYTGQQTDLGSGFALLASLAWGTSRAGFAGRAFVACRSAIESKNSIDTTHHENISHCPSEAAAAAHSQPLSVQDC